MTMKRAPLDPQHFDLALNLARHAMYRFLALSFTDPRHGSWSLLSALRGDAVLARAAALLRNCCRIPPSRLGRGELPAAQLDPAAVLRRLPEEGEELDAQYESCFGLLVSGSCPPYETEYVDSKFAFQRSNSLADVAGFYHAFGMSVSRQRPERPDHIVLELEYMALLLTLERRSIEESVQPRVDRAAVCREAQARFLGEHLAWWTPAFGKLLNRQAPDGFYGAAGRMLAAFIPMERELFQISSPTPPVATTGIERPEACDGCGMAG